MEARVAEEDRRDIQDALEGDAAAFAKLVRRYEVSVAAQMWRFTRDRDTLDELHRGRGGMSPGSRAHPPQPRRDDA